MGKTIGQRIKELREKKGLTQKELSDLVGCAQTTIAGWEALANRGPGKKFITQVAQALEVSVDYLFGKIMGPALAREGNSGIRKPIGKKCQTMEGKIKKK